MDLVVCSDCHRHISAHEPACPFCAQDARAPQGPGRRLAALLGASLIGAACAGPPATNEGAQPAPTTAPTTPAAVPVPPYGVSPIPTETPAPPPSPTATSTPTAMPTPTPTPSPSQVRVRERPIAVPAYGMPPQRERPEDILPSE